MEEKEDERPIKPMRRWVPEPATLHTKTPHRTPAPVSHNYCPEKSSLVDKILRKLDGIQNTAVEAPVRGN